MENNIFKKIVQNIDQLNEAIGRQTSWLVLSLVLTTFLVATLRYGFSLGWIWLQELYVWMHGAIIMLAAAYTLLHDGHVRIDIFYRSLSPNGKAWVNLICTTLFLLPTVITIAWFIFPYVLLSWERFETSREAGGMQGLFIWKTTMMFFCILLLLQGVALILKSVAILFGPLGLNIKNSNETGK